MKKVVWIFTETIPVIWESETADRIVIQEGWNHDITLTQGLTFNVQTLYNQTQQG